VPQPDLTIAIAKQSHLAAAAQHQRTHPMFTWSLGWIRPGSWGGCWGADLHSASHSSCMIAVALHKGGAAGFAGCHCMELVVAQQNKKLSLWWTSEQCAAN